MQREPQLFQSRASVPAQGARDSLFQNLQNFGRISLARFTDQQVNVFGHDHVADQGKCVTRANFVQQTHKTVSCSNGSKIRTPPVTGGWGIGFACLAQNARRGVYHLTASAKGTRLLTRGSTWRTLPTGSGPASPTTPTLLSSKRSSTRITYNSTLAGGAGFEVAK